MDEWSGPQWAEAQFLGDPQQGTFDQGVGVSTQQLQNPNTTLGENRRIASGPAWMQSLGVLVGVVIFLAIVEAIIRRGGEGGARARIGIENSFLISLMVAAWFYMYKTAAPLLPLPGAVKQFIGTI